jgi:hypothetical protein
VVLMDDPGQVTKTTGTPSELYVYVGQKRNAGTDIERAGLVGGALYGVQVHFEGAVEVEESDVFGWGRGPGIARSARVALVPFGDVASLTGQELQARAQAAQVTRFRRFEDGTWDPRAAQRNDFYCATTASSDSRSRLWRLRFDDVERPEQGGTLEMLLTGDEGQQMFDNVGMDGHGRLLLQEDPGAVPRLAKIWLYDTTTGRFTAIAEHDPAVFSAGSVEFLTENEESSGIIDAEEVLGRGWFLLDVQTHVPVGGGLGSGGQLLALWLDPSFTP